jgi:hypothetical protein
MLSATSRGLEELASFRARVANDYGTRRNLTFDDLVFINEHLDAIESKMVEIATKDTNRIRDDEKAVDVA